jgi:hypothetical protein
VGNTVKLVYFDDKTDEVHIHSAVSDTVLTPNAIFIDTLNCQYRIVYYNDKQKVAFALRVGND